MIINIYIYIYIHTHTYTFIIYKESIYVIQSSFIWKTKCQYFYGRGKKCIKEHKREYTKLDAELFS